MCLSKQYPFAAGALVFVRPLVILFLFWQLVLWFLLARPLPAGASFSIESFSFWGTIAFLLRQLNVFCFFDFSFHFYVFGDVEVSRFFYFSVFYFLANSALACSAARCDRRVLTLVIRLTFIENRRNHVEL